MMAEDDLDGILNPAEQQRLLAAVPEGSRPMVVFALLTGIRQAEQWWLKPEDISRTSVTIRRSSRGKPPKNGKNRTVFLLEPAQRALELAPGDSDWVWPAIQGGRRAEGKAPRGWHRWVKAAKLRRRVRWHDLRHTCATSLLAGWWGRKWSLDEVCQMLGHSSVKVTERYARKLAETMRLAVAETLFPKSSPLLLPQIAKTAGKMRSRFRDLNSRPAVYETAGLITQTELVWALSAELFEIGGRESALCGTWKYGGTERMATGWQQPRARVRPRQAHTRPERLAASGLTSFNQPAGTHNWRMHTRLRAGRVVA
jgi:Phage integrase family